MEPVAARLEPITALNLTAPLGATVIPVPAVRATDGGGRPIAGIEVTFTATGGVIGRRRNLTDSDGIASMEFWVMGTRPGVQTVVARTADGQSVTFTATTLAGPPRYFQRVSGNGQSAAPGETLTQPLAMQVVDGFRNPLRGQEVVFSVVAGGGTISPNRVVTDTNGYVESGPWTLGTAEGVQRVRGQVGEIEIEYKALAFPLRSATVALAFERDGEIFSLGPEQSFTQLTTGTGTATDPAWSPNGRRLAYTRSQWNGPVSLYLTNEDGTLTQRAMGFGAPTWSPDGRWLAVQGGSSYDGNIYVLPAEDDRKAPILVAEMAAWPAWSPDGRTIAFVALSGDDGYHTLDVINHDGSGRRHVTLLDEGVIGRPAWSPDGTRIAFSKCLGGCAVYTVDASTTETTELAALTDKADPAFDPAWSPDGRTIAVTVQTTRSGAFPSIFAVPASGGTPRLIADRAQNPAWRRTAAAPGGSGGMLSTKEADR